LTPAATLAEMPWKTRERMMPLEITQRKENKDIKDMKKRRSTGGVMQQKRASRRTQDPSRK